MKLKSIVLVWWIFVCGIFAVTLLDSSRQKFQFETTLDSSRWFHFLIYASLATVSLLAFKKWRTVLGSLIILALATIAEAFHAGIPLITLRSQTVPADLFGIAAGILLGLNIWMLRSSPKPVGNQSLKR